MPSANHKPRLPPFGVGLAERQKYRNPPTFVVVCVGRDCWINAKKWNQNPDVCAMVLPPDLSSAAAIWPVDGCMCIVDWGVGPDSALIIKLVHYLIRSGAAMVTVRPLFADKSHPSVTFDDISRSWVQCRESIKSYFPAKKARLCRAV